MNKLTVNEIKRHTANLQKQGHQLHLAVSSCLIDPNKAGEWHYSARILPSLDKQTKEYQLKRYSCTVLGMIVKALSSNNNQKKSYYSVKGV